MLHPALILSISFAGDFPVDNSLTPGSVAGAPSGPSLVSGRSLSSLDFVHDPDRIVVAIGTTEAIQPDHSRSTAERIVLRFPGAQVPQSLRRQLDASSFAAAVRQVHARPVGGDAEVVLELTKPVDWDLSQDAGGLWLLRLDNPVYDARATADPTGGFPGVQVVPHQDDTALFRLGGGQGSLGGWDITLENAALPHVFAALGTATDTRFVLDETVTGTIDLRLIDASPQTALHEIVDATGLDVELLGDGYRIGRGL